MFITASRLERVDCSTHVSDVGEVANVKPVSILFEFTPDIYFNPS